MSSCAMCVNPCLGYPAIPVLSILSLHDALPICAERLHRVARGAGQSLRQGRHDRSAEHLVEEVRPDGQFCQRRPTGQYHHRDRKSTRLNSSHMSISYAVFCLKKKKKTKEK